MPVLEAGCSPRSTPLSTAWPFGSGVLEEQELAGDSNPLGPRYEGGARPVEHRRPVAAASAGVEPTRPRFRASIPSRGPGQKQIQSQRRDSNPHAPLYKRGARPVELHWLRTRVDSRVRSGTATVTGSHAPTTPYPPAVSTPARSRTWTCSFGGSHDLRFTTRASVTREGVEPSRRGGHGLLRTACLPIPPPGHVSSP